MASKNPFYALLVLAGVVSVTKTYPTVGDAALWIGLLGCCPEIWEEMRYPLLAFCLNLYASVLLPLLHDLWLVTGTGNANFFYAASMVYGLGGGMGVTDILGAALRTEAKAKVVGVLKGVQNSVVDDLVVVQYTTLVDDAPSVPGVDYKFSKSKRPSYLDFQKEAEGAIKRVLRHKKIGAKIHQYIWVLK